MCKAWNGLMGTDKVSMLGKLAFWNESLPPTGEASLRHVQIGELIRTNLTSIAITHFTVTCSVRFPFWFLKEHGAQQPVSSRKMNSPAAPTCIKINHSRSKR